MAGTKELMGASTGLMVLGVLARGGTSYGYEIVRRVNEEASGLLVWQEGTLYPVLHKLEKQGLVRAEWRAAESGRERKYYQVTAKGRATLREEGERFAAVSGLVLRVIGASHA
jgi:DNA-binding PadR family transcriptional regulator